MRVSQHAASPLTKTKPIFDALLVLFTLLFGPCPARSEQASTEYSQAETLIGRGQFNQGAELASQLIAAHPEDPRAHNLLGISLTGKRDLDGANRQYRKALSLKPDFLPALKNLAINELTQHKIADAQRHFAQAERLAPSDMVTQAYLGKIAFSRNEFRAASSHFAKAGELRNDPTVASQLIESELRLGETQQAKQFLAGLDLSRLSAQWQSRIGILLAQHALFQEAIPFFHSAHATSPGSYESAYNLAICFVETKQFPAAIDVLRKFPSTSDNAADLDSLLAEAYEGSHQTHQAIDALREAIRLAPDQERSFVALAALCIKYESYDLGLQVIELGLRHHPESKQLFFQRGAIHALRNEPDLAESDFLRVSQIDPALKLTYAALGESYIQSGDYQKAVESLHPLLKEHPHDSTLQYLFGKAVLLTNASPGDPLFAEAKAALERSFKSDPQSSPTLVELARVYTKENRLEEALGLLLRAKTLDPKNRSAYYQLAIIYRKKGDDARTREMLSVVSQLNQPDSGTPKRRLRIATE